MSYRVETASSNRAVCKATECKNAGIKIDKGELRLGSWVAFEDRGSWAWKHWGCVSGKQLENLRGYLEDPSKPGVYRWDFLDGYEGEEKNSLEKHPDLQEKVRRVITQGFIDPNDFNGDPEMNKLGESGLRTTESKRRMKEQQKNRDHEIAELQEKLAAVESERDALAARGASTSKMEARIGGVKAELEQAEEEKKPVIIKNRVKDEPDGEVTKKAPKKKAKTTIKKQEESEEEEKPVMKGRGKKNVKREYEESESEEKPMFKGRGKRGVKREHDDSDSDEEVMPAKKARGKKPVKKEEDAEMAYGDELDASASKKPGAKVKEELKDRNGFEQVVAESSKTAAKRGRGKKAVKIEFKEENSADSTDSPQEAPSKRGRGKKAYKVEKEEEDVKDTAMMDVVPVKKARGNKGIKREASEDMVMADAPASSLSDVEDLQAPKAEAKFAARRGDPFPATPTAEEIVKLEPRKLSKGKKAAVAPRRGIDRRALSRGKTES